MRLPVIGRFLGLHEVPRQRQMDRVERLLYQPCRFRRRGNRAQTTAQRRVQTRLPLAANVKDLLDVRMDETVSDFVSGIQGGLRFAVDFVRGRQRDGAAKGA